MGHVNKKSLTNLDQFVKNMDQFGPLINNLKNMKIFSQIKKKYKKLFGLFFIFNNKISIFLN